MRWTGKAACLRNIEGRVGFLITKNLAMKFMRQPEIPAEILQVGENLTDA